ncbi:MAG: hypothetical protein QG656_2488 [Candidatus Hydrogenedentes bacterium]|jgi:hypothetical protein|nr:hypothetical protein [Candidatus Hydrogenedentota bacterium]
MKHVHAITTAKAQITPDELSVLDRIFSFVTDLVAATGKEKSA